MIKLKDNILKEFADSIWIDGKHYFYNLGNTYPFIVQPDVASVAIGEKQSTHGSMDVSKMMGGTKRMDGRIWGDVKVISFWAYPRDKKALFHIIDILNKELKKQNIGLHIDDKWKVEIPIKKAEYTKSWSMESLSIFLPVNEYTYAAAQNPTEFLKSLEDRRQQHTLSPMLKPKTAVPAGWGSDKLIGGRYTPGEWAMMHGVAENLQMAPLLSERKLYGLTIQEVLDRFLQFENYTLVFFDTETLSLRPGRYSHQLIEVAAIAFDGSTFQELGRFHRKVKLSRTAKWVASKQDEEPPRPDKKSMKFRDILKMTGYGESHGEYLEEQKVLREFSDFLAKFPNPLLVAHNATFDMKFIHKRGEIQRVSFRPYPVLDTLKIAKLFFIPALQSLGDLGDEKAKAMLQRLIKDPKRKQISASLGMLAPALEVDIKSWHSAFADVESTVAVLRKIIEVLKANVNLDIRKHHAHAVTRDFSPH